MSLSIPSLEVVTRTVAALRAAGLIPAVGGSGLLVAFGLAEVARDWDVTVDASDEVVSAALDGHGLVYRDGTVRTGVFAAGRRYVIDGGDHDVDLLVRFALRGPDGVERLPSRVTKMWRGLPIGDPTTWARAYRLLGRRSKAEMLESWLGNTSARASRVRPFYSACADMYDVLVTDPVGPWVQAVAAELRDRVTVRVLDAGCGTGRHAAAFLSHGWDVELVDASTALLDIAVRRCPGTAARVTDICDLEPTNAFDAVVCRGVLNDLLGAEERAAAVRALAAQLRPDGVLILDVRERAASRIRATGMPTRRTIERPNGDSVSFTSSQRWSAGYLVVSEMHEMHRAATDTPERYEYEFTMLPWAQDELCEVLHGAGLSEVSIRPGVGRVTSDRLLVTARFSAQ